MCKQVGIITDKKRLSEIIYYDDLEEEKNKGKNISDWKYKLKLGKEVYISTDDLPKLLKNKECVIIKPGDFVLLMTKEFLKMPNDVMGFISIRFDYKSKGLINVSGFHVDPGYEGKLIFSAYNAGPRDIVLRESDPVFMIFFEQLSGACEGKERDTYYTIPSNLIEQIRGKTNTLAANATRIDKLEFYTKVIGGLTVALIVALLGVAIRSMVN